VSRQQCNNSIGTYANWLDVPWPRAHLATHCTVLSFAHVAWLYNCTLRLHIARLHIAQLHDCTIAQSHNCMVARIHGRMIAPLHSCMVHDCTVAKLHGYTILDYGFTIPDYKETAEKQTSTEALPLKKLKTTSEVNHITTSNRHSRSQLYWSR